MHTNNHLETVLRNNNVLRSEGERADSGDQRFGDEDVRGKSGGNRDRGGRRGSTLKKRAKRTANRSKRSAEPSRRVIIAGFGRTEVNSSTGGIMKVIPKNETIEVFNHGNVENVEVAVLNIHVEIDTRADETGATDTTKTAIVDAVRKPNIIYELDAVGEVRAEGVSQNNTKERHGASRVCTVGGDDDRVRAGADLDVEEACRGKQSIKAIYRLE